MCFCINGIRLLPGHSAILSHNIAYFQLKQVIKTGKNMTNQEINDNSELPNFKQKAPTVKLLAVMFGHTHLYQVTHHNKGSVSEGGLFNLC